MKLFLSYFAQYDVSLPSGNPLRRGISTKFDSEKVNTQQLFQPIEKVSLMVDTWTTTNRVAILGIMIHSIDDMWNLHERVLVIEELNFLEMHTWKKCCVKCLLIII